jgi:CheY-like chemotaxis protein
MANPKKRILIVDDETDHRDLLKLLLLDLWALDVVVAEASHGQSAVLQTQQWHPHIIVMDLLMPHMDGYEAIRRIRTLETMQMVSATTVQPCVPKISIIALSADVCMGGRSRALAAGCDNFIAKPYSLEEMYFVLHKALAGCDHQPQPASDLLCVA